MKKSNESKAQSTKRGSSGPRSVSTLSAILASYSWPGSYVE